jgi:hypothetical protein
VADHVYRRFKPNEDFFHTRVHASPRFSGNADWSPGLQVHQWTVGIDNPYNEFPWLAENTTSLYGGVRSRDDVYSGSTTGVEVYPIDEVDTHSIDKIIGVPGQYPQTGSLNLAWVTNTEQPSEADQTDVRWYDQYWSVVDRLREWYSTHTKHTYPTSSMPDAFVCVHVPEMFYGRQIATGSVLITNNEFPNKAFVDDGYGRLLQVTASLSGDWKTAWMSGSASHVGSVFYNEGLITFNWTSSFSQSLFWSGSAIGVQFDGMTLMQSMVFMCRMAPGEVNASRNPTYYYTDENGKSWARSSGSTEGVTYVTAIGLYDQERRLVAVAKLAQPIRKRERDNIDIRLRLDV